MIKPPKEPLSWINLVEACLRLLLLLVGLFR
jgi:hypothetical protein